ncbi:hypothetical protein [Shewanella colwelliana]|uniref:hypothetical protein n=1 Tax=Shewanella colwelliana TaxID=23 RepID=UPI003734D4B2
MTKITLLSTLLLSSLSIHSVSFAQDPNKMTYEKAMKSDRETFHHKTIPLQETIDIWDRYVIPPKEIDGGSDGGQLEEVWTGSAASVPVTWGQGDYYVEMTFNKNNTAGSVWLTVDNTHLKKSVAIPSPYNYEANWHIMYESGTFKAVGLGRGSTTPSITRISKFPTPQLNDCNAGQTEYKLLYCTGSGQMTCEEGRRSRTCATNGGWMPWQTIKQPSCITGTQQCR